MAIKLNINQFQKLGLLHSEIKKKFPLFIGFNGSMESMEILGADETLVKQELDKIDVNLLIHPEDSIRKTAVEKLKILGLTEEEIDTLFYGRIL